jgi:hypothetical protein
MDRQRIAIITIGSLIVLAGIVSAVRSGNTEFLYYGSSLIAIMLGVLWLDRVVRLPVWVLWGLLAWLILHLAGGLIGVPVHLVDEGVVREAQASGTKINATLYNVRLRPWLPRYDQFVHAFGFFLCTLAGWRAVFVGSRGHAKPTFGPVLGAGLIGMGCGGVNEVIEFVATRIMPHTNVGGFVNTGWDLVSNLAGCILGMLVVFGTHRRFFSALPAGTPG